MRKDSFSSRSRMFQALILLAGTVILAKLFYIQVLDSSYEDKASKNIIRQITIHPTRGLIYDRKGKLIVVNDAVYDLLVVPGKVKPFDTLELCRILDLEPDLVRAGLKKARKYSRHKPSVFQKQLSPATFARFSEVNYKFPGFYGEVRSNRGYPLPVGALALGYTGEISPSQLEKSDGYYRPGDYIGISGIEKTYEEELRGQRGVKYILVDVHNRDQGPFKNREFDTLAISGNNLVTTLDITLQKYAEDLMRNKKGSVVAIEPATGEILAFVSSPSYDPNLLTGNTRGKNFEWLLQDTLKPLFNRPIMANYPPGSTFKAIQALIAMNEKALNPDKPYTCLGFYTYGGFSGKCHRHDWISNVEDAIRFSCNAYFWECFRTMVESSRYPNVQAGLDDWADYLHSFGLGINLGIDIPNELAGLVPDAAYYNKLYKGNKWRAVTVISLAIGQGELSVTPLQLANFTAVIANRGFYYKPHLVKFIEKDSGFVIPAAFTEKLVSRVEPKHFEKVIDGLEKVVTAGTARVAQIPGVVVCGKTGTAQNPHGIDHSTFIAFAPKENPKIAIAAFVENSGWGSSYAAPIASLMIEKYLADSISTHRLPLEKRMFESNLIQPAHAKP